MLQFFRRHQRGFFLFTTIVIIISFTFFGTFSTIMNGESEVKDVEITKAVDGSSLRKKQVDQLAYFLSSNSEDSARAANLFNDGVIEKDFLATGLGELLVEKYFEVLKPDLASRLRQAAHHHSYAHPQAPFINAEAVWSNFDPALAESVSQLKQRKDLVNKETFSLLSSVYVNQKRVPAGLLRYILSYQQKQVAGIQQDPELAGADLSLFGFHTIEDWLGPKYLELVSQFILNASSIAKQRGYSVSKQEARASLLENLHKSLTALAKGEKVAAEDVQQGFYHQLKVLGLNEEGCVELWQHVLLFRRLFQETGNSVMLDPLMNKEFHSYARQTASVNLYELPRSLQLTDLRSLLTLQVYLDSISAEKNKSSLLALPKEYLSLAEMEKRAPELVRKNYSLEFAEVDKNELLLRVGLKDTWAWQLEDSNWERLNKEFSFITGGAAVTRSERFSILEKLEEKDRLAVDGFAREQIINTHPEWLQEALQKAPRKTRNIGLCSKGDSAPFKGVSQNRVLMNLLDAAPLKGEASSSVEAIVTQQRLSQFSEDGRHYYAVTVVSRDYNKHVLTFAEANTLGILDTMLDAKLEKAYPEARKKDAAQYQAKDGTWKPLSEVKDLVGAYAYADLLRAIEQEYVQYSGSRLGAEQKKGFDLYTAYRFLPLLKEAKAHLELNPEDARWVLSSEEMNASADLSKQWLLVKSAKEVSRGMKEVFQSDDLFLLPEKQWSPIMASKKGSLSFFQMLKRTESSPVSFEEVQKTQGLLSLEAQRQLMQEILEVIAEKKAICFSANTPAEVQ